MFPQVAGQRQEQSPEAVWPMSALGSDRTGAPVTLSIPVELQADARGAHAYRYPAATSRRRGCATHSTWRADAQA